LAIGAAAGSPARAAVVVQRRVTAYKKSRIWPSMPPPGCPFVRSKRLCRIAFTGRYAHYGNSGDTFFPTWASNGNLYTPYADGWIDGIRAACYLGKKSMAAGLALVGSNPLKLKITDPEVYPSVPAPYGGRYPCGSLVYNGVWYYGTYCLTGRSDIRHRGIHYNWPLLGPFVGFRWTRNYGRTWIQTPCTPAHPLFSENSLKGQPIRIGAPHFVDLGKNLQYSPDGKAYLVAQGATDGKSRHFGFDSWITADLVYLLRVKPSIKNMNDATKYQFFAGRSAHGLPIWTNNIKGVKPVAAWRGHMGCVTMTYDAPLKTYLMCVTNGMPKPRLGNASAFYDTYILESRRIAGPFRLVSYMRHFGTQGYFVNIPSKFIAPNGRTMWLCYSANFCAGEPNPVGSGAGLCLQEIKLLGPEK
jgi:hypothetical protein